jgi:hypothetical protein
MSTLKADTIVASDGTSPATLTKQSAAKAWILCPGQATSITASFNISSLDDDGTAEGGANLSSVMNSANYVTTMGSETPNNSGNGAANVRNASVTSKSASTVELSGGYTDASGLWVAYEGSTYFNLIVHGDLA